MRKMKTIVHPAVTEVKYYEFCKVNETMIQQSELHTKETNDLKYATAAPAEPITGQYSEIGCYGN